MHNYRFFAKTLVNLLGTQLSVQIHSPDSVPLSIKDIGRTTEGHRLIAISQRETPFSTNGQDIEMVFALQVAGDLELAMPVTLTSASLGIRQSMYMYDEHAKRTLVNHKTKSELTRFALNWFANLKKQEVFDEKAVRVPME